MKGVVTGEVGCGVRAMVKVKVKVVVTREVGFRVRPMLKVSSKANLQVKVEMERRRSIHGLSLTSTLTHTSPFAPY